MYDPGSWSKESSSFNARTKRRMGERDVWDLIVNNDDICFKHIIPRLNGTDLKFLYEVNTETRKLIKRSSREKELKGRFKVSEMSSISTLEIAWKNKSLWPSDWSERVFCWQVAETNKLELLKWAREEKKCKWNVGTIAAAAKQGNLEMIKYCVANECPIGTGACADAAENGHLECLKYLREEVKVTWNRGTASMAALNGHLHILEYLVERKYDQFVEDACWCAAKNGHLDCLKYLHETAKAPWDYRAVQVAHRNNHSEYAVEEENNDALWRLFRNAGAFSGGVCRDVVEKHVLPRLNGTDLKFLYGVNTETRKLIKRSSREGELKKAFKIEEMSSISTLEFAWENKSLWQSWLDETCFCMKVARTNKLELLKWAREEKKCEWNELTIIVAAGQGNLEMVKYCVANKCPIDERACAEATENGHLEVLKYLREEAKARWDFRTADWAAENGHLHILEYLVERKYDRYNEDACANAAMNGHLDCLKYLHETAKWPWYEEAVREAHQNNHPECVQYLLDNDCPLPEGWSYANGELHKLLTMTSGEKGVAMTRLRKRKVGQRDSLLWDLIVDNDDICFTHILPRLNGTDVKFLHLVNTETRKLIKRSSRAGDLKEKFKVREMSSISTLEFAWENKSLWPSWWSETRFCEEVALTNKLELLKWAREEKKCEWDEETIRAAVEQGNLEMVKYCVAKKCPINEDACAYAAFNGHLEVLKYLREEVNAPWDFLTANWAAQHGHLHILEYLVERKFDKYSGFECQFAAEKGHLDCLKYLHETAKAPWDEDAVFWAHKNNQTECVQYLLDNNCPLPDGWRYEDGELHSVSGAQKRKKRKEKEELALEMERLKLGPTKLWTGLVLHHKDVFVSHVISKLNTTDRCFFASANRESCDVLKYAGVNVPGLGWGVHECSSISTLEWAWNNFLWGEKDDRGRVMDQAWFCRQVADTNKLELLKWAREVKQCEWDEKTITVAALIGNLEMLKYCFSNGCPYDEEKSCKIAAINGHLDCLRFLFDKVKPSRETEKAVGGQAAGKGCIDILKYLVEERKIPEVVKVSCVRNAVGYGQLDCLKYLVEEAKMPLNDWRYIAWARYREHTECENYLLEKGSPEPTDEVYAAFVEDMKEQH
ncbi:unnamed protein product [Bathycoccus prasinos]